MKEYKELIAEATPLTGDRNLANILIEELPPYFMGERTALEVTRKIDNRIQLYLNERH